MKRLKSHLLRNILTLPILFFIVLIASHCGGSPLGSATSGLTSNEQSIFNSSDDSTFSLPVTIAKLKSVDVDKVLVTHGSVTTSSLTKSLMATSSSEGYTVTGSAGAADISEASYVMLVNDNGQVTKALSSDGSFEIQIAASEGDITAILLLDATQNNGSPPIYTIRKNGVTTFILSNSNVINIGQNLLVKDRQVYFSAQDTNNNYTIYRKSLKGTDLEVIATDITSTVRYLAADDNANITYITQDGKVYNITSATSNSLSLVTAKTSFATTWSGPTLIHDFGTNVAVQDSYIPPGVKVFYDSTGRVIITNKQTINANDEIVIMPFLITIYNPITGTTTSLMPSSEILEVTFAQGSADTLWVSAKTEAEGVFSLYKLDITKNEEAWDQRVTAFVPIDVEHIVHLAASENDYVLSVSTTPTEVEGEDINRFFMFDEIEIPIPQLFAQISTGGSEWMAIAPNSDADNSSFVTCVVDPNNTGQRNLVIHRVGTDSPNEFYRLTNSSLSNACTGVYSIDLDGHVSFYQTNIVNSVASDPQLSLIDIDTLSSEQMALDDTLNTIPLP